MDTLNISKTAFAHNTALRGKEGRTIMDTTNNQNPETELDKAIARTEAIAKELDDAVKKVRSFLPNPAIEIKLKKLRRGFEELLNRD